MQIEKRTLARKNLTAKAMALALLLIGFGAPLHGQSTTANGEKEAVMASKFYCNIKALNPTERGHHKELTAKLIAARKEIVEADKGYEFQYTPEKVTLAELADWVVAESKCCPFLDFHIDFEREGKLLCLRLTGDQGIKPFIETEFQIPVK